MNKQPRYVLRTLKFVNNLRKVMNIDPVKLKDLHKGKPVCIYTCPISRSLQENFNLGIFMSSHHSIIIRCNTAITRDKIYNILINNKYFRKFDICHNDVYHVSIYNIPCYISEFMDKFDKGKLKQYEL